MKLGDTGQGVHRPYGSVILGVLVSSEGAGHPTVETRTVQCCGHQPQGGCEALEMWLIQLEMCHQGKYITDFDGLVGKKCKISNTFHIDYTFKGRYLGYIELNKIWY